VLTRLNPISIWRQNQTILFEITHVSISSHLIRGQINYDPFLTI
jgi:hypothetical protein